MRYAIALTAVLTALALSGPANAQSTQGKYCLTGATGASANCSFQSMAACEKAKTGQSEKCMPNSITTGSGAGTKDNSKQ